MKIRVLHIIKTLQLGGAEVNLLNLISALDKDRFESFVAYSLGGELEARFIAAGVRLFKFADGDHKLKSLSTFVIVRKLAAFIRENKISVVHTHTFNAHIWGGLAAKLSGARLIEHVHDFRYLEHEEFVRRRGSNRQFQFARYLKNFSDRVVVLTGQNEKFLTERKIYTPERVVKIPNGIPMSPEGHPEKTGEDWRRDLHIPPGSFVVLTPVRIAPEKNVDLILRIAPEVARSHPETVFVIAGDGPLFGLVKDQINRAGLGAHFRLPGFIADIRGLLEITDVFLLPSFLELHSIAVLEAMSMARPLLISKGVGCHEEFIINGVNGVLHDPFVDAGWADSLIWLIENEQVRRDLGHAAQETCAARFDIRRTRAAFEKIYSDLIVEKIAEPTRSS